MAQTLSLEKTVAKEILQRLEKIELLLSDLLQAENVVLSPQAKKRFRKIEKEIKKRRNLYKAKSFTEFRKLLTS